MKEINKFIIHNYTNLEDIDIFKYVIKVIDEGKVSHTSKGDQYCFATLFNTNIAVETFKRGNTYTFKVLTKN